MDLHYQSEPNRKSTNEPLLINKDSIITNSKIIQSSSNSALQHIRSPEKSNQFPSQQSLPLIKIVPIIITLCLSSFYFGYTAIYLGALNFDVLIQYFDISLSKSLAMGLLNGFVSIGAGVGCLLMEWLTRMFSRRNLVLLIDIVAIVAGFLIFIPNQIVLLAIKFIQGICVGLCSSIIPIYVKQISPINFLGTFGTFVQIFMSIGTFWGFLFTYIMSIILDDYDHQYVWYWVFGFTQITLIVQILVLVFVYPVQTPKYLILQENKQKQTKQLLKYLYKQQFVDIVYGKLKEDLIEVDNIQKRENIQNQIYENQGSDNMGLKKFGETKRKTPFMAVLAAFFMAFSQQMTGMGAVVVFGGQIVGQVLPQLKHQVGFIINSPQLITSIILSYLLKKYATKYILQIGMIAIVVVDLTIGVAFLFYDGDQSKDKNSSSVIASYVILIGNFLYNTIFGISVGSIFWVFMATVIQPNMVPYATILNWISISIVLILFPLIKQKMPNQNPAYLFIFFGVYTFISFLIYFKLIIQIKGKNQTEIHKQYKRMRIGCIGEGSETK